MPRLPRPDVKAGPAEPRRSLVGPRAAQPLLRFDPAMRVKAIILFGTAYVVLSRLAAAKRRCISFAGRTVLITGGSRGLGLELARQFLVEGAHVALMARDADELERALAELRETRPRVMGVECDVTQPDEVAEGVRKVVGECGRLDVLVNNAGVIQVGPLEAMTERDFEESMDVHFRGPLHLMLAAIPHLRRQGGGRIVNIVSIGGKIAVPHLLPYSASKFALAGLSNGMRNELRKDNIFVTTVFPGLMRTGSIYNAWFKGRTGAEFGWFGTAGSLPLLSMDSACAARKVVEACRRGSAQLTVGLPAKVAGLLHDLLPGVTADALALIARLLPGAPSPAPPGQRGIEARPARLPRVFTALSDAAAVRNNELLVPNT